MASFRMLRSLELNVDMEGSLVPVFFAGGNIYKYAKIEVDSDNYCDIYLDSGDVIKGVAEETFEILGKRENIVFVGQSQDTTVVEEETDNEEDELYE